MIHGQLAARVTTAVRALLVAANVDPTPLLQQHFSPAAQDLIRRHFT